MMKLCFACSKRAVGLLSEEVFLGRLPHSAVCVGFTGYQRKLSVSTLSVTVLAGMKFAGIRERERDENYVLFWQWKVCKGLFSV